MDKCKTCGKLVDKCKTCGSARLKIGITNIASGATVYPIYCAACGEVFAKYLKKEIAREYARENGPLRYLTPEMGKVK